MKVYVVEGQDYEGGGILGVYSNLEKAEGCMHFHEEYSNWGQIIIYAYTVDSECYDGSDVDTCAWAE